MVDVIQALYVGEFVLWIDAHILEGGSTLPYHNCGLGRAVQRSIVERPVAGNQSDRERHDGFPEAACFHRVTSHRTARPLRVWRGFYTSHGIVEPDAFVDPLLKEPVQIPAADGLSSTTHILTGDMASSFCKQY